MLTFLCRFGYTYDVNSIAGGGGRDKIFLVIVVVFPWENRGRMRKSIMNVKTKNVALERGLLSIWKKVKIWREKSGHCDSEK